MEKMINKWLNEGKISPETASVLLEDVKTEKARTAKIRINILIYTIAAILIGIGVIVFISANDWLLELLRKLPLLKITALSAVTVCSLFGGYKLAFESTKFPKLGHALIFLSTLLIGGTYALIGQTYNINANNYALLFVWFISILPVAYIFKNNAINIVSIILFILGTLFFYIDLNIDNFISCAMFLPILIGTTLYIAGNISKIKENYHSFSLTYKLVGLVPIYTMFLILTFGVDTSYTELSLYYHIPLYILIIANVANYMLERKSEDKLIKFETIYMISVLAFLIIIMNLSTVSELFVVILSHFAIISMISIGYFYGYKYENPKTIGLINWFLIIYLIINYCHWGWSSMEKATFFILGGICLLATGMFLETSRRKVIKKDK